MSTLTGPLSRLSQVCRTVTAGVLTPLLGRGNPATLDQWLRSRPARQRWTIIGATLGLLLVIALVMSQFGWIGLAAYFAAIVLLVR